MKMTPDAITSWLAAPAALPDGGDIDASLRAWPWFTPIRLMDAMREHQQAPFSEKTLATLQVVQFRLAAGLLAAHTGRCV